jgi:ArsR family transcriptional regulator, arsenate/arsenite/antimonite-responsive transcriptional repressor / arsenate reductase (thioredoxin)
MSALESRPGGPKIGSLLKSAARVQTVTAPAATEVFAALAQETRLETFRLLLRYQPFGLAAGDIARLLAVPHNTLSSHLGVLVKAGLVLSHRHGRLIVFSAAPDRMISAQSFLTQGLVPAAVADEAVQPYPVQRPEAAQQRDTVKVLVLCSANSARSLIAEAIINREGQGRVQAYSAGSRPAAEPHAQTVALLASLGYDTSALRAKSWSEFALSDAPAMDVIITVCDTAADEVCPQWLGDPLIVHWGIPDPVRASDTADQQRLAFQATYRQIMSRATAFINLPMTQNGLQHVTPQLRAISRMDGATPLALLKSEQRGSDPCARETSVGETFE